MQKILSVIISIILLFFGSVHTVFAENDNSNSSSSSQQSNTEKDENENNINFGILLLLALASCGITYQTNKRKNNDDKE